MGSKKKQNSNSKEIIWNIINSALAGSLIFLGGLTAGNINTQTLTAAFIASAIVFVTRFRDYWAKEEAEYKSLIFKFL